CQRFVCCRASEPAGDEPPAPSRTRAQEPFLLSRLREARPRPLAPAGGKARGINFVSRAQRSTISAFTRVCARYGDALLNRDLHKLRAFDDPGSAVHR